jgi:hypothetical protein
MRITTDGIYKNGKAIDQGGIFDLNNYLATDGTNSMTGNLDLNNNDLEDGNTTIWDTSNSEIPSSQLGTHDNNQHTETYAIDGNTQPPKNHGNTAHSTNYSAQGHSHTDEEIKPKTISGNITSRTGGLTQIDTNTYKSNTTPSNPVQGDQWIDTGNHSYKIYNGSQWATVNDYTAIPDSEGLEHNDLTGVYAGDTGPFSIGMSTVYEGSYALFGDGGGSFIGIIRSNTEAWDRYGIRITWQQFNPSSISGNGGPLVATSETGFSSADGYAFYVDGSGPNQEIRRVDSGSTTTLDSDSSSAVPTDQWSQYAVEFQADGTVVYETPNATLSDVDENYTQLLLGYHSYRDVYIDDVQFSQI